MQRCVSVLFCVLLFVIAALASPLDLGYGKKDKNGHNPRPSPSPKSNS